MYQSGIQESHQGLAELRRLHTCLKDLAGHESTIEAPVNTLVQMIVAIQSNDEVWLWVSVAVGLVSMVKSFAGWEAYGRIHMKHGGFEYVTGACKSSAELLSIAFFRLVEIACRLCSLLAAHEAAKARLDMVWVP